MLFDLLNFLENYPHITEGGLGLNPKNGLWKAPLHTQLRPKFCQKFMALGKSKVVVLTTFKLLSFLENYPPKSVFGFNRNYTQSYDSRKCQYFDLMTVVWTFLVNYPDKSGIVGLIETTDC